MDLLFKVEPFAPAFLEKHGMSVPKMPFSAIGVGVKGALKGVACFSDYHPGEDITITVACDWSPARIRAMPYVLRYVFDDLKLPRVTALIRESNPRSMRLAEFLGFKLEGKKRGTDIRYYGLTLEDWNTHADRLPASRS